jgi:hypothetical protein
MKRLPARTSATLRAMIDQAGPVSAATRALLWLGADAAGLPISPAGRETISNQGLTVPQAQHASFLPGRNRILYFAANLIERGRDEGAELQAVAPGLKWSPLEGHCYADEFFVIKYSLTLY